MSAFDSTFEAIKRAADPKGDQIAVAHMWEFTQGWTKNRAELRPVRDQEIDALLGVMGNEPGSHYSDKEFGQPSRDQVGHPQGAIGLATSSLIDGVPGNLYSIDRTGLLLIDPPPVLVHDADAWTRYNSARPKKLTASVDFERCPDPKVRQVQRIRPVWWKPWENKVNPLSSRTQNRARRAYRLLVNSYEGQQLSGDRTTFPYNEICVNAKLEHVGGIIAQLDGKELDLSSASWAERLAANPHALPYLEPAILDYQKVAAKLKEHGITRQPTIVIYQPQAKNPDDYLVHFPPTEENIALVQQAIERDRKRSQAPGEVRFVENYVGAPLGGVHR